VLKEWYLNASQNSLDSTQRNKIHLTPEVRLERSYYLIEERNGWKEPNLCLDDDVDDFNNISAHKFGITKSPPPPKIQNLGTGIDFSRKFVTSQLPRDQRIGMLFLCSRKRVTNFCRE
jgi:hypothetical protein